MKKPLQGEALKVLVVAGAVTHTRVIASNHGLYVEVNKIYTVATRSKRTRYFQKADTLFSWLTDLGVKAIDEVDLTHWQGKAVKSSTEDGKD